MPSIIFYGTKSFLTTNLWALIFYSAGMSTKINSIGSTLFSSVKQKSCYYYIAAWINGTFDSIILICELSTPLEVEVVVGVFPTNRTETNRITATMRLIMERVFKTTAFDCSSVWTLLLALFFNASSSSSYTPSLVALVPSSSNSWHMNNML